MKLGDQARQFIEGPSAFEPADTTFGLVNQAKAFRANSHPDVDYSSVRELITYGIKGMCSYVHQAIMLGNHDDKIYTFIHETMAALTDDKVPFDQLIKLALKVGEMNLATMELLDAANTVAYGHPVPTNVPTGTKKGKAILISGEDLKDLEELLK